MADNTQPARIAVVSARWHSDIVDRAVAGFEANIHDLLPTETEHFTVPGAYEIPLHAQRLARTGRYDAIIACAFVVDGGIYRHEFVANTVVEALMRIQLETDVPIFSGVLTPHNFHAHQEHIDYFTRHFEIKGKELAEAAAATLKSLRSLARV
ncbi:MAG TPA: 6,7-dimethyl-8-ribityllumazine synthase [Microbacteriaceae bacterium]|nr:6,7-dimethyl-8-ribityllumazine synthase [Microbacteriaceae bacterium]